MIKMMSSQWSGQQQRCSNESFNTHLGCRLPAQPLTSIEKHISYNRPTLVNPQRMPAEHDPLCYDAVGVDFIKRSSGQQLDVDA